jgi:hypothetical protein
MDGFGSVKSGLLFGMLQHPRIVQQLQALLDDQLIPYIFGLMFFTKVAQFAVNSLQKLVPNTSLWFGLSDLAIVSIDPFISFMQMTIGILLSRTLLHYTSQDVLGLIITFAIGLVVDALMRYKYKPTIKIMSDLNSRSMI